MYKQAVFMYMCMIYRSVIRVNISIANANTVLELGNRIRQPVKDIIEVAIDLIYRRAKPSDKQ